MRRENKLKLLVLLVVVFTVLIFLPDKGMSGEAGRSFPGLYVKTVDFPGWICACPYIARTCECNFAPGFPPVSPDPVPF